EHQSGIQIRRVAVQHPARQRRRDGRLPGAQRGARLPQLRMQRHALRRRREGGEEAEECEEEWALGVGRWALKDSPAEPQRPTPNAQRLACYSRHFTRRTVVPPWLQSKLTSSISVRMKKIPMPPSRSCSAMGIGTERGSKPLPRSMTS